MATHKMRTWCDPWAWGWRRRRGDCTAVPVQARHEGWPACAGDHYSWGGFQVAVL